MYERTAIKERARALLRANWGNCIGAYVLYTVGVAVVTGATLGFGALFLAPPLLIGLTAFFLDIWRERDPQLETLFTGFRRYSQSLISVLWTQLFTFLWSLLFVIPGIIKSLAYSMTPYLVADYPDLNPRRALKVSMAITDGHKAEIFVMYLSFFGWMLLSGLTMGILQIVYVGPYTQMAVAGLYEALLRDALERGAITEADLRG